MPESSHYKYSVQINKNEETEIGRKQVYGYFKRLTIDTADKARKWQRKRNLKRENEYFLMVPTANYRKAKIDKTQ